MADLNANINVGIETTDALNQLKNLQRQISQFHQSVSKSSATAATAQRDLQRNFLNSVNAIQGFSAELKTVRTTAESFTNSLEKNKFSMREYFRFAAGATKTFGKSFAAEFSTIEKTAIERVKTLQTQYIKMGRDASGAMQAIAIRPTVLDMKDLGTQTAIAAQKQVLFNQLVKQGSTNLLNFGKNTQWAGRQLMVGFTLPLATLGMTAGRVFMDMEKAALKFRKVYGDLFTPAAEREAALESIVELGQAFSAYGVSVAESLDTAADAAAAGFAGVDLQNQTAAALKLSVLGQLDLQKALETTISLQNAFQLSSANLAGEIDFLNAVENQTVVALSDITEAVPRVAPVIQQLGGDVRDLAFFLAAMKEGGVNAAQGANALKSGLASLINPTEKAAAMLAGVGINIRSIISANQGNLAGIVFEFAKALDTLDPLRRAQAIEQLFGKFQFARLSALFDNITRDGTQAQRVLQLAGSTAEELASLSESELGVQAASSMNKFRKAIEQIKVALVPIGELFVEIATPFVEFGTKMLDAFNTLPEGIKKGIGAAVTIIGGLGPIALMTFGLINNGIANMIKFFATVRLGYLKITGQAQGIGDETQYMTQEQLQAAAAAASLDQAHSNLIQRFTAEKVVVDKLRDAYSQAVAAGARFANLNPGMMVPGRGPQKFANGGFVSGSGNGDTVPAMLTPGEFVVNKKEAQVFLPLLQAINEGKIPGFYGGGEVGGSVVSSGLSKGQFAHVTDMTRTSVGEFDRIVKQQGIEISRGFRNWLDQLVAINKDIELLVGTGFGFDQKGSINTAMRSGGAVSVSEFQEDFKARGMDKWKKTIKFAGESFKDVTPELELYDKELANAVDKWAELNNKTTITSEEFAKIERAIRDNILDPTGKLKLAIDKAESEIHEVRANLSQAQLNQAGYTTAEVPSRTNPNRVSATKRVVDPQGRMTMLRTSGNSKEGLGIFGYSTRKQFNVEPQPVESEAAGNADMKAYLDGRRKALGLEPKKDIFEETRKRNSPHQLAAKDGKDDAVAYTTAFEEQSKSMSRGPRRFSTNPAVMQALASASAPAAPQSFRNSRRFMAPAGPPGGFNPGDPGFIGPLNKSMSQAGKGFENFAGKLSKISLATSSVAGILTIFGGEMSAVTGTIFGLSSAMFALIEITSLLSKTKIGEMAASRAATVAAGMGGTVGSLLGTGGFMTRIANGFKFILRFLGPVGIGLSALAIAVPFIVKLYEDQKTKMEAFGRIVGVTADQIKFLGEQSGASVTTTSGFSRATLGGGTEVASDQAIQNAKDEQFLEQFKTQIDAAKAGAKESVNQALSLLAFRLSSSGLPENVVDATVAGIIRASKRTDLEFDFNSVGLSDENMRKLTGGVAAQVRGINAAGTTTTGGFSTATMSVPGTTISNASAQQLKDLGTSVATILEGLSIQLEAGKINVEEYGKQFDILRASLIGLNKAAQATAISAAIDQLFPEDKKMADAIKGIKDIEQQMLLLELAGVGTQESMQKAVDVMKDDSKTRVQKNKFIKEEIINQKKLNNTVKAGKAIEEQSTEAETLREKIAIYKELRKKGIDAALAYKIAGDAALTEGYKTALAADGFKDWIEGVKELEALAAKFEGLDPNKGGTGGSSPVQDAIDNLKKQKQEVINTSNAYAVLRRRGMDAQKAIRFAENPDLLSAMAAGVKAGTKQWDELIKRIQAAEKATRKWQNATVQGQTEKFMNVYSKVQDLFSAEQAVLEATFEATTKTDNQLIKTLEGKIDSFNRQVQAYSSDLDDISEKENEINNAYDKKVKALEQTKKINEDILRQQKSQLSIADALSQGDVAAAASAMQDLRAQNAATALQSQGDQLQLAREAQIAGLKTPEGLTRTQVEEKIKQLKKEIAIIETGALQAAKDRVQTAQEELQKNIDRLEVGKKTKAEWEAQTAAIDLAKARAVLYDAEVNKALNSVNGIVAGWQSLNTTVKTTHVVETINTGGGGSGGNGGNPPPLPKNTVVQTAQFTKAQIEAKERAALAAKPAAKPQFTQVGNVIKKNFASGGLVSGVGNRDTVPAMLTPGEFVINKKATESFKPLLSAVNYGNFNKPIYPEFSRNYASENIGGGIYTQTSSPETNTRVDNSVYNYNLNVNVEGTNATPDQIANVVMRKLQTVGSQRVRGQVVR